MRIINIRTKNIKDFMSFIGLQEVVLFVITLALLILSFSMGILIERNRVRNESQVIIEYSTTLENQWASHLESELDWEYFASKNGKKFYTNGCNAGSRVKSENRVFFKEMSHAIELGYTLSSSC